MLPSEKKDKLADALSKDMIKEAERHYRIMREREVSVEDANDVLKRAWRTTRKPDFKDLG